MSTWQIVLLVLGIIAAIALFVIAFIFAPKNRIKGSVQDKFVADYSLLPLLFAAATNAELRTGGCPSIFPTWATPTGITGSVLFSKHLADSRHFCANRVFRRHG